MGRIKITNRGEIKPVHTIEIDANRENIRVHEGKIKRQIDKKYSEVLKRIERPPTNIPLSKQRDIFAARLMEERAKDGKKLDKWSAYLIASRIIIQ